MTDNNKEGYFMFLNTPKPTDIIWIAKDVSIYCNASHITKAQRKVIKFLTGWRYESITKGEG